jgi:hypothetical protein
MPDKDESVKSVEKPWLFQPGNNANPKGRPKGTLSLKTFAKNYIKTLSDEEKLKFMEGLPKDIIWKMAEGNPRQDVGGGEDENGEQKPILVKFIDGSN